jgi:hypothetical protein
MATKLNHHFPCQFCCLSKSLFPARSKKEKLGHCNEENYNHPVQIKKTIRSHPARLQAYSAPNSYRVAISEALIR